MTRILPERGDVTGVGRHRRAPARGRDDAIEFGSTARDARRWRGLRLMLATLLLGAVALGCSHKAMDFSSDPEAEPNPDLGVRILSPTAGERETPSIATPSQPTSP